MNVISPGNLAYSAARCYQQTARPTTTSLLTANLCHTHLTAMQCEHLTFIVPPPFWLLPTLVCCANLSLSCQLPLKKVAVCQPVK